MLLTLACAMPETADSPVDSQILTTSEAFEAGPEITCPDPSARAEAPLVPLAAGADWDAQFIGDLDRPAGWGMAVADFDGDGILDVFLPQPYQDELYRGQPDGTLVRGDFPVEEGDGLGASSADYDGDGDPDLYVTNQGQDRLYRNDGGVLVDVTFEAGISEEPWRGVGAAWADMDGDEDLDLIVANNYSKDEHPGNGEDGTWTADPNQLYENLGDGTFAEVVDAFDPRGGEGFTYMVGWIDADVDGDQDLYVVNDKGGDAFPNALLLNDGTGAFTLAEDTYTDFAMDGMGLGVADLNDDLVPDLAVPGRGYYRLMISAGDGTWVESASAKGLTFSPNDDRVLGWGTELQDLDNDGRVDLVSAFGVDDLTPGADPDDPAVEDAPIEEPDALYLQNEYTRFVESTSLWGIDEKAASRGIVLADLNNDGSLDYLRRQVYGPSRIFVSNCGAEHWSLIRLRQEGLNRDAIGARVVATVDGVRQARWISAGSKSLSSSGPHEAHFGLGAATTIDELAILWPDGTEQVLAGIPADRVITIPRP